ncbi:hypothetical protein BGY98DRAFT_1186542 [Russula aff. rugulosa BPL654]|nr:hypothetical protein BGY98DRAFT_1186542 [Russula aff. rugulosa BPL654]
MDHPSIYLRPTALLQWLSFVPQLEMLLIHFLSPVPNRGVGGQVIRTPITTHVTLPNPRCFRFQGVSTYLEALVRRVTAPRLEKFEIRLFMQLTFSAPTVFWTIDIIWISIPMEPRRMRSPHKSPVGTKYLPWLKISMSLLLHRREHLASSQMFSTVKHLSLGHEVQNQSSEEHNEVYRIDWRKLLSSFNDVKALGIRDGLVEDLSRCLRSEDGEDP